MASGAGRYYGRDKGSIGMLNNHMDDDDRMTAEFLNTSSSTFLASDRLQPGPEQRAVDEAEVRRQEILRQMQEVEHRTLQSTKNSKILLHESEKVGLETAEELVKQREQLSNTERKLDNIMGDLKDTQKNINSIKSVFSSLKTWWNTPKQDPQKDANKESSSKPTSPSEPSAGGGDRVLHNPNLGSAYERSQTSLAVAEKNTKHPALQLRGFEEEEDDNSPIKDFRETSRRVNDQLDADLDEMSQGLSRLKGLAQGLGEEIVDQNTLLDRISEKAERADTTIGSQNTQMKKLLKR